MGNISPTPVLYITIGLSIVALAVLVLPLVVKVIEVNMELFFLAMGLLTVTISGLWSWGIITGALAAPVIIDNIPVGIFQVVLIAGLLIRRYSQRFSNFVLGLANRLGAKMFVFLFILMIGILSSVFSVILMAVILAEVAVTLPISRSDRLKIVVTACFAAGMGAVLTPLAEPLSTILVAKLAGPPYYAGFFFPLRVFGLYVIPSIVILAIFGAFFVSKNISLKTTEKAYGFTDTVRGSVIRALKVYVFVVALTLLGEGFKPLIVWYFKNIPAPILYWINIASAFLDNGTLTAIEIGPTLEQPQIVGGILGLLIAGGMLIPGNIPNIISAARLRISMKEWAKLGIPMGLIIMLIFFLILKLIYAQVY
jgi:predicted cation transporter